MVTVEVHDPGFRHAGAGRWQARLDSMLAAGRITAEEAARVRAAEDGAELESALMAIRLRHARERLRSAVDSGRMSQGEADLFLERVAQGEDPRSLRSLLHGRNEREPRSTGGDFAPGAPNARAEQ